MLTLDIDIVDLLKIYVLVLSNLILDFLLEQKCTNVEKNGFHIMVKLFLESFLGLADGISFEEFGES